MVLFLYHRGVRSFIAKIRYIRGTQTGQAEFSGKRTHIVCPLCGTKRPFSNDVFLSTNLDNLDIISISGNTSKGGKDTPLSLSEISKKRNFAWLTRQIIARCIEIIKKLTD